MTRVSTSPPSPGGSGKGFDPKLELHELVDKIAEEQAKRFNRVTSTQLRRYFHDIKEIYRQIRDNEKPEEMFKRQLHRIKLLRSKAAYDAGRDTNKIDLSLKQFIEAGVQKCNTYADFEKFVLHFEAVVGFFYGEHVNNRK